MRITHLRLANWRNFKSADVDLQNRVFIVGPNASGKSNLLDALRFLRETASAGFQQAVGNRGGLGRVRCLAARNYNHGRVTIAVAIGEDNQPDMWEYEITFKSEGRGHRRPILHKELVRKDGKTILKRPDTRDSKDSELLTQTHLEHVNSNEKFRPIAKFLTSISYLHLVPQFVRHPERVAAVDSDPYGTDLLLQMATTNKRTREKRLRNINRALKVALPQLDNMELIQDKLGKWHLQGRYEHWRAHPAFQDERDFSDGTLRLIGLLWALQGQKGPVLLEEPELSLHSEVVRWLPSLFHLVQREGEPQVILTTHSPNMLEEEGINPQEVVLLEPGAEGTNASTLDKIEQVNEINNIGVPIGDFLIPLSKPESPYRLALKFVS